MLGTNKYLAQANLFVVSAMQCLEELTFPHCSQTAETKSQTLVQVARRSREMHAHET
jgi:hypothetical protein